MLCRTEVLIICHAWNIEDEWFAQLVSIPKIRVESFVSYLISCSILQGCTVFRQMLGLFMKVSSHFYSAFLEAPVWNSWAGIAWSV